MYEPKQQKSSQQHARNGPPVTQLLFSVALLQVKQSIAVRTFYRVIGGRKTDINQLSCLGEINKLRFQVLNFDEVFRHHRDQCFHRETAVANAHRFTTVNIKTIVKRNQPAYIRLIH
jgi:hypothetical protein